MNKNFDIAFKMVLTFEGGLVNDPDDPGGISKYGLSQRAYPNLNIAELTIEQAKEIYFTDYWIKGKCHKLPDGIDIYHFDTCVNVGIRRANKFLQLAINKSSKTGYIKVDGIIGPKTLGMLATIPNYKVLTEYACIRNDYYVRLASRKNLRKFLSGWIRRSTKAFGICMAKIFVEQEE